MPVGPKPSSLLGYSIYFHHKTFNVTIKPLCSKLACLSLSHFHLTLLQNAQAYCAAKLNMFAKSFMKQATCEVSVDH
jgi:hypothetical protein